MMTVATDAQIKQALQTQISAALTSLYTGSSPVVVPKVYNRWILSHDLGESAALLRATEGKYKGKIHAWMIGVDALKRSRSDEKNGYMSGSFKKVGPHRRDTFRTYKVWAYTQLDTGTDIDNSEDRLAIEVEYVSDWISKQPMLGLVQSAIQGHTELQFPVIDTFAFGEVQANVAQGSITVIMYKDLT